MSNVRPRFRTSGRTFLGKFWRICLAFCWLSVDSFWYFWPRNINIHLQQIHFASTRISGRPFLGHKLNLSLFPKKTENIYPTFVFFKILFGWVTFGRLLDFFLYFLHFCCFLQCLRVLGHQKSQVCIVICKAFQRFWSKNQFRGSLRHGKTQGLRLL